LRHRNLRSQFVQNAYLTDPWGSTSGFDGFLSRATVFGAFVVLGSIAFAIFYVAWFFGLIPALSPDLSVRIPILVIVLALCFIAAWLGWIMLTSGLQPPLGPSNNTKQRASID